MHGTIINNHISKRKFGATWDISLSGKSTEVGYKIMNSET